MTSYTSKVDLEARKRISEILRKRFLEIAEKIERGEEPEMLIPKRTLSNTIYDPKRKLLLLGDEKFSRKFFDLNEARKFMQTTLMASIIYESLINNEYPTIRDLYYRGKHTIAYRDLSGKVREENTWDEQAESDAVIRDIEVYTGLLREHMLILSKEKGKVVGNMRIRSGGDVIDLSKLGHGAYAIEPTPDLIEFLDYDAEFVLVVEKDAVFQQLHRIGFWKQYKALLVTSAGQPDRATRRFVRRLNEELKLPVYILTDSDPYGWYIYSVFKVGSITLSYESERLATPKARFLGVSMTDIFGDHNKKPYLTESERKNFIIRAKERDIKRAKELMTYPWFQTPSWGKEIKMFLDKKVKLEIEALTGKGLKFLAFQYIPEKIQHKDWIE
ncbi:MAG: DNA topoisomerase IV subunit A [Acidilobaceae archaeon]